VAVVKEASLEPAAHQLLDGADGAEFLEQGVVGDAVKAPGDVSVEDELGLEADEVEHGFDGVVGGASWAEAV
jgi:hypothetical protein